MAEWRAGRGWTDQEIKERLKRQKKLPLNLPARPDELKAEDGWNRYRTEGVVGREVPGSPLSGGVFEHVKRALAAYEFSETSIVRGHFNPDSPLLGREMLLEIRVLGLHYLSGVRVSAVRHDSNREDGSTTFGFRYDTVRGHIERGSEWFFVTKDHDTGWVSFRIEAVWRPGDLPNWWSKAGFHFLARRYQRKWHRKAYQRLRARVAPLEAETSASFLKPVSNQEATWTGA